MYAVGVCWKRDGWIFSLYKRVGEAYPTLKVRMVEGEGCNIQHAEAPKTMFEEVVGFVGRFGKA